MRLRTIRLAFCALALIATSLPQSGLAAPNDRPSQDQQQDQQGNVQETEVRVCSTATGAGLARCHSRVRTDAKVKGKAPAPNKQPVAKPNVVGNGGAYDPAFLESAYNLGPGPSSISALKGRGQTVGIVDAYDAPNAESDLAYYRSFFGLSACTTANGCFRKLNQAGATTPLPAADASWAQEISLDLDMVSAICPNCNILLIEANSNGYTDLGTAVNAAAALGANVISNSYGGSEFSGESSFADMYYNHPNLAVVVSSGDNGYGVEFPAASGYVTAVGGTTLNQATAVGTRNATETAWTGAGSGCSAYEPKPAWQSDGGCARRTVADVAAVADPSTGVWVYDTYGQTGWLVFGGTSVAAPVVGATYALAENSSVNYSETPYRHASSLFDIVSGSNGSCGGTYLCTSLAGYDGPTGLGTPNGAAGLTNTGVAPTPSFGMTATPSSRTVTAGASTSYTATLTASGGYNSAVNLQVSNLPASASATFSTATATPTTSGATSTLTVATAASTPPGTYTLTLTGTGTDPTTTTRTATVSLVVSAPKADFSISATPASATAVRGGQNATYSVSLGSLNGYNSSVQLSVSGLPARMTASFSPSRLTPSGMSSLSVDAGSTARRGTYTLTITGAGADGTRHTTTVRLTIS